ncbi:MAG: hypothetical protein IKL96_12095 [Kiritimatiellae bacterium]|nr:hypothetical protein [Kiritimatiellia bacterium]
MNGPLLNVWVGALRDGMALRLGTVAELRALDEVRASADEPREQKQESERD